MIRKAKILYDHILITIRSGILHAIPALYGALEIEPSSCNIMLTNRCNMRCVMCRQWREKPESELSTDEWKQIIDDLKKNGIRNIHFTGGEPLLRTDLAELVSFSRGNGVTVGMTTNGMLLTSDVLNNLIDMGLRSIALSIDATSGEYEKIRGLPGSYKKLEGAAVTIADAMSRRGIDAYINFTLMKDNIGEFEKVKKLVDRLGIPIGVCLLDKESSIFKLDENKKKFWIGGSEKEKLKKILDFLRKELTCNPRNLHINYLGIDYIADYFEDPRQACIPCVISQDRIFIDPYGNLFGGCLAMGTYGNVNKTPFEKLKKGQKYMAAKKSMFYKMCPGCSCGYMFNIRHIPGLILKDIGLRIKNRFLVKR